MDKSQEILSGECPLCGRTRTYTTKQGYVKGLKKPCKSCSNSINAGGVGWTGNCIDCGCALDYNKSSSLCLSCHNKRSQRYSTQTYRFKKYGVTREWYEEEVQKGCRICGVGLSAYSLNKRERGHIDHCHLTDKVRGVLCDLCNKGLGQFKDSVPNLEAAIDYLKGNR